MGSHEEPTVGSSSGAWLDVTQARLRRRHSSYQTRSWSAEGENIQLLVERFLAELGRRLDFIEEYGHLNLDAGIERAYSTLHAVRESCSHVSDEVIDAGRRRVRVFVETLESRYRDVMARKETVEQKVKEGVQLMESTLADFEARAYAMRDAGIGTVAEEIIDVGWKRMDEGLERAREVVDGSLEKARVVVDGGLEKAREVVDGGLEKAREVVDDGLEKARRARDRLQETVENAIKRAREHGLITYQDLPEPWRVNPHILRGYRFSETKAECIRSVVTLSNELVNIWSHLIGLIIVLTIAFYVYPRSAIWQQYTKADIFTAAVFFFAACKCLVCSTMWHTMSAIAEQSLMERFACVDYTGISLLVAASILSTEYTAFYCEPVSRWTYMLLTATLGIGGTILPWHPTFNRADMAWARVGFYVTLATTGFFPILQISLTRGLAQTLYFYAPVFKSVLVYFTGAILYACKVPERFKPGVFDYVGGSHNIWHIAVLGGILFHYFAMQDLFAAALERARTECPVIAL